MTLLKGSNVVLGVTGGIAAYKAADLASKLVQAGARVETILTRSAQEFVRPLTFSALTRQPVHSDTFEAWSEGTAGHISLGHGADALVIAPATANTIARLALGLADDLLGMVALATTAPLIIAPAMEHQMFLHPATQGHVETLRQRGATFVGPDSGRLASGEFGTGRLSPVEDIVGAVRLVLGRGGPLDGRRIVVTAAGTQEPIDPVRFIGNRSSGKMGYAIAQAALDRGGAVTLISGASSLRAPYGAEIVRVGTALEMNEAVNAATEGAAALVMAAAVADYRSAESKSQKIKKEPGQDELSIALTRNPDIVAGVNRPGLVKIGFAAETERLLEHAEAKLAAKGLAMIVANDAVSTIGSDESTATFLFPGRPVEVLTGMPKHELAGVIMDRITSLLTSRSAERVRP